MKQSLFLLFIILSLFACEQNETLTQGEMLNKIENALKIPGYEYTFRQIIYNEDVVLLFNTFKIKDSSAMFSVLYNITAGFDIQEGYTLDINEKEVLVGLPEASILSVSHDISSLKTYFGEQGSSGMSKSEIDALINEGKASIQQEAIDLGILKSAELSSKRLIRNILMMAGFETINFKTIEGANN